MKSFRSRLTLWYALVVSLTVIAVMLAGRYYLERNLVHGLDLLNEVEFEEVRSRMEAAESREAKIEAIRKHAELDAALYHFQVTDERTDRVLFKSASLGNRTLPTEVHGHACITVNDPELGPIRSAEFKHAGMDIYIASSLAGAEQLFANAQKTGLLVVGAVFIVSLLLGRFLSILAIRPISAIQDSARRIHASNFHERIPVPNTEDEISRMAELLNAMLDRLEAAYEQVNRFTAEASHELKTPLSIIRLQAERMANHPELPTEERSAALAEQIEEVGHLNGLIEDLLLLAKSDAGVLTFRPQEVNLNEFIDDFKADAELLAADAGSVFTVSSITNEQASFDPALIRRVLLNLLSNALKVSSAGDKVELAVATDEDTLFLRMIDSGPGLPETQLTRIFNRFERFETDKGNVGNGLGLAICQSLVRLHGGSIRASRRKDADGLVVEVLLPRRTRQFWQVV